MKYRDAMDAMIRQHGLDRLYWDGTTAREPGELLASAAEADAILGDCEDPGYFYHGGLHGKRPGVYRVRPEGEVDPEPVVELLS